MTAHVLSRPNGKTYRPRTEPRVGEFFDYEERTCLVVEFTHDLDAAADLVREAWSYNTDCPLPVGRRVWWRLVPFDTGCGYDRSWIDDPVRGTACVVFDHQECCR